MIVFLSKKRKKKGSVMSNKTRIAPTMTILEEKFKNDVNPQWITFHMTHILLYSMYYSGLCKSKRDVCAFFWKIAVRSRKVVSQSVCMYVCMDGCMCVVTRLEPYSRNVQTWNFVRMFRMNRFCVVFFKFLISRLISPLTRKMGFSVGTHLKAEKWPKSINFF